MFAGLPSSGKDLLSRWFPLLTRHPPLGSRHGREVQKTEEKGGPVVKTNTELKGKGRMDWREKNDEDGVTRTKGYWVFQF